MLVVVPALGKSNHAATYMCPPIVSPVVLPELGGESHLKSPRVVASVIVTRIFRIHAVAEHSCSGGKSVKNLLAINSVNT